MTQMSDKQKGLLGIHSASLLFGGTALFSKAIALPALDITALRSVVAVVVLLLLLLLRKRVLRLASLKHLLLMVVAGVLLGLHWVTYFQAMQVSSVAVGMIALFTHPVITIFLEPLFKGAKPHRADIACGVVVLFGVYLMVPAMSLGNDVTMGVLWGISSAFLFSLRNVIQGHYLSHYGGELSVLYQGAVVVLMTLPFVGGLPSPDDSTTWIQLAVLGAIFTAAPHSFFAGSLHYLKTKTASLVSCLQPFYGTLFAFLLLSEQPTLTTVVGGLIVISASVWESYRA